MAKVNLINFKKEVKGLKKPSKQKIYLGWLSAGCKIEVTEEGRKETFLIGFVTKIEEQKLICTPKKIELKVTRCDEMPCLCEQIIEMEFIGFRKKKNPIFKINRTSEKIVRNQYLIKSEPSGIAA